MKPMILILSYRSIKSTLTNFLHLLKWINLLFIHFFCYKYVSILRFINNKKKTK